jgi:DNA processing protein
MAQRLGLEFAAQGFTVVSGPARGIDSDAHQGGALDARGKTVAVLGCGVDVIYPPENRKLAQAIIEGNGAIISESPIGTRPIAENFPARNRLVSGGCLGVVIVEAAEKSGSLMTERMALEQDRQVFAAPGSPLTGKSRGSKRLLKRGRGWLNVSKTRLKSCSHNWDKPGNFGPAGRLLRMIAVSLMRIRSSRNRQSSEYPVAA